jgi:hypothetical protein
METKSLQTATSKVQASSCRPSCISCKGSSGGLFNTRNLIIGGIAIAGLGLSLGLNWLTLASLAPLLFLAPCLAMMYMCMKGHTHDKNDDAISTHSSKADIDKSAAAG